MSITVGGVLSGPAVVRTPSSNNPPNTNVRPNIGAMARSGTSPPPALDAGSVRTRHIRPQETREFHPTELRVSDPPEIPVYRPPRLEPPRPDTVEARPSDIPATALFRARDLKDVSAKPVVAPDMGPLDPRELKPALRFEEVFFQPRQYRPVEAFKPREMDRPELGVNMEGTSRTDRMDLPVPDAYGFRPRPLGVDQDLGRAYRSGDQVIHRYPHQAMGHFHYHYNPVPADDVQPPRDRSIVLPRKGGVLDTTG